VTIDNDDTRSEDIMKRYALTIILCLFVFLVACTNTKEITITLLDQDMELYESYTGKTNETIELPVLDDEDLLFIGWESEEDLFYGHLVLNSDLVLSAVFEDPEDVFLLEYRENETISTYLVGYRGRAKHLRIPEKIGDTVIDAIGSHAFQDSNLVEVEIPNAIQRIEGEAFSDTKEIKRISFYGDYAGTQDLVLLEEDYQATIDAHSDLCSIVETDGERITFAAGCPIRSVSAVQEVLQDGILYPVYHVRVDLAFYMDSPSNLIIQEGAFAGLTALEEVVFSSRYDTFQPFIFENTPRLKRVLFPESPYYTVIDQIVYDDQEEHLIYYPSGLTNQTFIIPDHVIELGYLAFYDQDYLETITIPDTLKHLKITSFLHVEHLKRIEVDPNNETFYDIDGVLFSANHSLITYPYGRTEADYVVPEHTKVIAPYSFYGQRFLESIIFPNTLTHLGYYAFRGVERLKVLDLPESVEYIDSDLTQKSSIETLIIRRSGIVYDSITRANISWYTDFPVVYVPDDSLDLYRDDPDWRIPANQFRPLSESE
jgi:hypothetical protein